MPNFNLKIKQKKFKYKYHEIWYFWPSPSQWFTLILQKRADFSYTPTVPFARAYPNLLSSIGQSEVIACNKENRSFSVQKTHTSLALVKTNTNVCIQRNFCQNVPQFLSFQLLFHLLWIHEYQNPPIQQLAIKHKWAITRMMCKNKTKQKKW